MQSLLLPLWITKHTTGAFFLSPRPSAIHAQATASSADALIARLSLEIEKLRRTLYGARSERKERLIDQLEMQLEGAEAAATEDELSAENSAPSTLVKSFERKRPTRKPFPEHLLRERIVVAAPTNCPCCGSTKLSKLGADVTETLESSLASGR
jgi:hypothetical protein